MKNLLLIMLLSFAAFAGNLQLQEGVIKAHTEQMMDSTINPEHKDLQVDLSMNNNDVTTLKGTVAVVMKNFISDNSDRDEHMYKSLEADKFVLATYNINKVTKSAAENSYIMAGVLDFHGVKKELLFNAKILNTDTTLTIDAKSDMKMSDYGVEMPCMIFMCVRDKVDLTTKVVLSK